MSRATDCSTIYVVADSVEQAAEDLRREWSVERRLTWAIDQVPVAGRRLAAQRRDVESVLRRGRLQAERRAMLAAVPADPTAAIRSTERELERLRRRRADLEEGRGTYANHPVNRAALDHEQAQENVARLRVAVQNRRLSRRERRATEVELAQWRSRLTVAAKKLDDIRRLERSRLDKAEAKVTSRFVALYEQRDQRAAWSARRPEAARRLDGLDREVEALGAVVDGPVLGREQAQGPMRDRPWLRDIPVPGRSVDVGIGR
jgi:DNA repair exonuclease SbcCD ATPase subunit